MKSGPSAIDRKRDQRDDDERSLRKIVRPQDESAAVRHGVTKPAVVSRACIQVVDLRKQAMNLRDEPRPTLIASFLQRGEHGRETVSVGLKDGFGSLRHGPRERDRIEHIAGKASQPAGNIVGRLRAADDQFRFPVGTEPKLGSRAGKRASENDFERRAGEVGIAFRIVAGHQGAGGIAKNNERANGGCLPAAVRTEQQVERPELQLGVLQNPKPAKLDRFNHAGSM
jgi:hypothetical protein